MRCVCHPIECQATWTQPHCDCSTYLGTQSADNGYMATWSVRASNVCVKEPKNILNEPRACVRSLIENEYYFFFMFSFWWVFWFSILCEESFRERNEVYFECSCILTKIVGKSCTRAESTNLRNFYSNRSICLLSRFCGHSAHPWFLRTKDNFSSRMSWPFSMATWGMHVVQLTPWLVSAFTDTWVVTMRHRNRCAFDSDDFY